MGAQVNESGILGHGAKLPPQAARRKREGSDVTPKSAQPLARNAQK